MTTNNNTLDRIQREIRESIQREKELKSGYTKITTNGLSSPTLENNESIITENSDNFIHEHNSGTSTPIKNGKLSTSINNNIVLENGTSSNNTATNGSTNQKFNTNNNNHKTTNKSNGFSRKFVPNSNTANKFVMQKFLKSRGRLSLSSIRKSPETNWASDAAFKPAKYTVEKGGKPLRNGFVPAEEKMKKELQEFQIREQELRQERRKSQPNLMAALNLEEENEFQNGGGGNLFLEDGGKINGGRLKPAKSMANLYNGNLDFDDLSENNSSASSSLKPARSLAELCDVSDDEVELPGTHTLIQQFESMKTTEKSSSK